MKNIFILLLLLPVFAISQYSTEVDTVMYEDAKGMFKYCKIKVVGSKTLGETTNIVFGKMTHSNKKQKTTLELLSEYKQQCYNDITVIPYHGCPNDHCKCFIRYTIPQVIHKMPTLDGFEKWLKERKTLDK